jgi:hypothetical protein
MLAIAISPQLQIYIHLLYHHMSTADGVQDSDTMWESRQEWEQGHEMENERAKKKGQEKEMDGYGESVSVGVEECVRRQSDDEP